MSAIVGIVHVDADYSAKAPGYGMLSALQHYPADDVQTWSEGPVFLGCHAQWITPESVNEPLPYYDRERGLVITADAILDNRSELLRQLNIEQASGRDIPDSQLILLAYAKWGEQAPHYLLGDYAFMIWDIHKHQLFGARDVLGHRTLYYREGGGQFAFSTVMTPLFTLPGAKKELNEQWLAEFLAIPDMSESVDLISTVYKQVYQVPPSHTVIVKDGHVKFSRFGKLVPEETLKLRSNEEYEEAFREVFGKAVQCRLRTRHQVGAALSGGLDSGTVVGFAAPSLKQEGKTLHSYSYVPVDDFNDWTSKSLVANEQPFIQSTIDFVGNIKGNYLNFQGRDPFTEMDDWLNCLEMPYKYFENSFWIKGIYDQAKHDDAGVLLTGGRGNFTISWGPAVDYYAQLLRRMRWVQCFREVQLYSRFTGIRKGRLYKALGKRVIPSVAHRIFSRQIYMPVLIHPELARRTNVLEKVQQHGSMLTDPFEIRKDKFENLTVASKNGAMATKMSLKYRLWERDPTSDPRVVHFCLSLPMEQYVQGGRDRSLIRRATKQILPDKVRLNQRVRGVQPADWVHRMMPAWRHFMDEAKQMSAHPVTAEYLNVERIKEAISGAENPTPEDAINPDFRLLMHAMIVYRFIRDM
ncbi:asparagine synthase-related protein [Marinicrinis lubricantis]|uniref:asparagine synthase (glutamine-hydrolyzing) n=1 Tax=Marinicrinis lubricantis TaxID=2086470 RepID=A0ABW1IJW2_9BACL